MHPPLDFQPLQQHGFQCFDALIPQPLASALADDCRALEAAGGLQPARVGRLGAAVHDPTIRGDSTCWIDADSGVAARLELLERLDQLRQQVNRQLLLGLQSVEVHYAVYPAGAHYQRHLDRFRDDDARVLSFTCYLNPDWQAEDGGALRVWLGDAFQDIAPRLGTATLFLSAEIEHAVLPARRPRYSIAGWFRRREQRY